MEQFPIDSRVLIKKIDEIFSPVVLFPRKETSQFELGVAVGKREIIEYIKTWLNNSEST